MEFAKAKLQEVDAAPSATPKGDPIVVQINPSSLRLQMTNNVDVGRAVSRSATQAQGSSSSTLTFDLVFDTADEGTTDEPVDVRTRTRQIERFVLPDTTSPKSAPPRLQFTYGTLSVVGVMSALNQDFDLFALSGVPLRARCSVTIKEQKPEFDAKQVGAGANNGDAATAPVPAGAAGGRGQPGAPSGAGSGGPPPDRTGTALADESASDFANRMGLDPRAWKDLAGGLPDPLRLVAGAQIDFSSSLSLDAGLGVEVGATATAGTGGRAGGGAAPSRLGRPAPGPVPAQPPGDGVALTAQGGLQRALDHATAANAGQAAAGAREAFVTGTTATVPALVPVPVSAQAAPAAERADARSSSFGYGVPLRPRVSVERASATGLVHERVRGVAPAPADGVPESDDRTVPRWRALPHGRAGAVATAPGGRGCACGCGGGRR